MARGINANVHPKKRLMPRARKKNRMQTSMQGTRLLSEEALAVQTHDEQDVNNSNEKFICDCGLKYANKKSLAKHKRTKHSGVVYKYVCPIKSCKSKCSQSHTLKEHMFNIHNIEVSVEYTQKQFVLEEVSDNESTYQKPPVQPKSNHKRVTCTCGKIMSSVFCLKRHIKDIHKADIDGDTWKIWIQQNPEAVADREVTVEREVTLTPVERQVQYLEDCLDANLGSSLETSRDDLECDKSEQVVHSTSDAKLENAEREMLTALLQLPRDDGQSTTTEPIEERIEENADDEIVSPTLKPANDGVQKPTANATQTDCVNLDDSVDYDQKIGSCSNNTIVMTIKPMDIFENAATISTSNVTEHIEGLLHGSTNKIESIEKASEIPEKSNNKDDYVKPSVKPRTATKRTHLALHNTLKKAVIDAKNESKADLSKCKSKNKSRLKRAVPTQIESRTKRTKSLVPAESNVDADGRKNVAPNPRSKKTITNKKLKLESVPSVTKRPSKRAAAEGLKVVEKRPKLEPKGCGASQQMELLPKVQSKEESNLKASTKVTATELNDTKTSAGRFKIPKVKNENITLQVKNFGQLKMINFKAYELPTDIQELEYDEKTSNLHGFRNLINRLRSDENAYISAFTALLHMDEAANSTSVRQFDLQNIRVKMHSSADNEFKIVYDPSFPNFRKAIHDKLIEGFTMKRSVPGNTTTCSLIVGKFLKCDNEFIYVKISEGFEELLFLNGDYDFFTITCHINRLSYQLQLNALKWVKEHSLFSLLITNRQYSLNNSVESKYTRAMVENHKFCTPIADGLNKEQRTAVKFILEAHNRPIPFLLFGPPGTGKTRTIVAAIVEIVRTTNNHILVCAHSNAACNEVAERLLNVLPNNEIFRMYAKSYDVQKLNTKAGSRMRSISNLRNGEFQFPCLKFLYQYRVVVCTVLTVGCLSRARETDPSFNSGHFSHIFIDEAAFIQEPTTMIPIAGLCTERGEIKSSIVLSGDPKQLEPVTMSKYAKELGFKCSFMEFLFNQNCYTRQNGEYNPLYIVQLLRNYRNHPTILSICNELFYEGILKADASIDQTNWFLGTDLLPNKLVPIIFQSSDGSQETNENSSYVNADEAKAVIQHVKRLLGSAWNGREVEIPNIGIITPYAKQCNLIKKLCIENTWDRIMIGTAESFQGQERDIIIISTVRTGDKLGFVTDQRRFNVMMTRAKSLLIIIGHHKALDNDPNWRFMINFCSEKGVLLKQEKILYPRITF